MVTPHTHCCSLEKAQKKKDKADQLQEDSLTLSILKISVNGQETEKDSVNVTIHQLKPPVATL
jgi:hypothetical protein